MAPWCIYSSCLERAARSGSGRDSVRGSVGAMNAELSRPVWLATVQSGRKQAQSRVCTPGLSNTAVVSTQRRIAGHSTVNDAERIVTGRAAGLFKSQIREGRLLW